MKTGHLFFIVLALISACKDPKNYLIRIDSQFVTNLKLSEKNKLKNTFGQKELKMTFLTDDFLPSGWDYIGNEEFYEIETIQSDQQKFLIYLMKTQPSNEIIDVRVATTKEGELIYNFPIWTFSANKEDYSLLKKEHNNYFVELYVNSEIILKYYLETGLIEHLKKLN